MIGGFQTRTQLVSPIPCYYTRVIIFLQACPQGSKNFRDVQCGQYNGRDIFINGERATWMSYVRGINVSVRKNPALYLKFIPYRLRGVSFFKTAFGRVPAFI